MNRSLLVCLLAASIAAPTVSDATTSLLAERMNPPQASISSVSLEDVSASPVTMKPGKSKKHKKKMSKQMKKRKRH
ncbi:MAG TPA: hypothetical protein VK658_04735 [Chryseolinea sp.]|nr:hypothetical protein [Chryseolinea sp.]